MKRSDSMQLGISTWGMPMVPINVAVEHIAQAGFDGLELTVLPRYTTALATLDGAERRRISGLLRAHGLILSAIAAHSNLLATDPEEYRQEMGRLKGAADLSVDMAQGDTPPPVNTTAGGAPEEWEAVKPLIVERLGELVAYAHSRGVMVAVEPHVGSALDTPQRVKELLTLVGSPYLGINFDISHFDVLGIPTEESVAALAPLTIHTHVKDQRGRYPDHDFLIPGEGDFDYVRYLRAMAGAGYDQFITVEISMMVVKRPDYDPLAAVTQSYRTLSAAFQQAGIVRPARQSG